MQCHFLMSNKRNITILNKNNMELIISKSQKNNPVIVYKYGKNEIFGSKKVGEFIFNMPKLKKQAIELITQNYPEPYRTQAIKDIKVSSSEIAAKLVTKICEGSYAAASTLAYYLDNNFVSGKDVKDAANEINPDTEEPYWMKFEELQNDFINALPLWIFNRINDAIL